MFKTVYFIIFFIGFFPIDNYIVLQTIFSSIACGLLTLDYFKNKFEWKSLFCSNTTLIFIWFIWAFISLFWTASLKNWVNQCLIIFISLFHVVSLRYLFKQNEYEEELSKVFILINVIHNIISWYEYLLGNYHFAFQSNLPINLSIEKIPLSFFYNQNFFAFYLLISFVFIVYWKEPKNLNIYQYLKYGLLISNILMILILRSLGITILLFVSFGVIMFLQVNSKKIRIKYLIVGFFIGALGIFIVSIIATPQQLAGLQIRFNLIINSLVITGNKILVGVGAGSMPVYMEQANLLDTGGYTVLHNWWIGLLVSHGLIFFIWYVYRYIRKIISSYKLVVIHNVNEAKWIFVALIIIAVGVFIPDSLFRSTWFWNIMVMISVYLNDLEGTVLES